MSRYRAESNRRQSRPYKGGVKQAPCMAISWRVDDEGSKGEHAGPAQINKPCLFNNFLTFVPS